MALLTPWHTAFIFIAIVSYILYKKWLRSKYPPGPWPLPIIGNLHQLSQKPYKELAEMAKIYGPVFTVWMAGKPTVVVADLHHMKEASAGQKGLDFAGRSLDTVGFRIMFNDNQDMVTRPYDEKLCLLRKIAFSITKIKAIEGFSILNIIEEEMQHFQSILKSMQGKQIDPSVIARLPVSNVLMRALVNIQFKHEEDPEFVRWTQANEDYKIALEYAILMNLAPGLAHLMIGTRRSLRSKYQLYDEFITNFIKQHEDTYQEGVIRDLLDIAIQCQRNQGNDTPPSEIITSINLCGFVKDILSAGILTSLATILWACLVLLYRKDVQCNVQKELDNWLLNRKTELLKAESIGNRQSHQLLFSLPDKPNLPYLNAFIQEVLRLWPPAPISVPHRTMADTSLGSHFIRRDTDILFNIYGINRDASLWENPLEFIPERFLDVNGQFDYNKAKRMLPFGAGPRSCVGENLAKMEIFICLANILHTFELCCPSVDDLPPLDDGHFGLDYSPYPFKAIFKLRNVP